MNRGYAEESSSSAPIPHLIFKIWNQLLFKNNCLSPPGIQLKFRLHIILIQLIEICKIHIQISRLLQSELLLILQCLLSRPKATLQLSSVFTCPRDRNGDYEPQLIKKYQNTVTQDMEEKILSMYAKGMTTGDIESHMRELYDIDISDSTISRITDKILPIVKEWQERPLEEVYAVVFMDAIHYHVRSEGRIVKRAVYIALGIDMNGKKDVLGMYVGENESAKFWLSIMNGLKNRGVEDILIACVDGLNGFPQAIEAVYPKTEIQQCIIHQIRNSTKFVSYKDIKKLMADLKLVYAAPTEETALNELELFKDKWDSKYPKIYKSWNDNWATLSTYFKYPEAVRRLIYTTNAIEGFNRQLRKVTKSKTVFPSDDSLLKMLYLATMDITKKWTGHRQDWGQIHSQLEIYFEERLIGRNL